MLTLIPTCPRSYENCAVKTPDGQMHTIPMYKPILGPKALDGKVMHEKTGMFMYDPGFTSTARCVSSITYIDGNVGQLLYRGYSIDKLAEKCNFMETCFLLLYGDLPSKSQLQIFSEKVTDEMMVHERIKEFYKGFQ